MAWTAVLSRVGAGVVCPAPSAAGAGPAGSDCAGWVGALSPAVIGGSQAANSQITAINPSAGAQASGMVRNAPRIRFGQGEAAAAAGSGPAGVEVTDAAGKRVARIECIERPYMFIDYLRLATACDLAQPLGAAACSEKPPVVK